MEEILASIRRILNEDEAPPGSPVDPLPTTEPAAEANEDVLVLDRSMLVADPGDEAVVPPSPIAEPTPAPPAIQAEPATFEQPPSPPAAVTHEPLPDTRLLAPEAAAAAASSVDGLLRTLAASRATQVYRGGPTLEDLVREEIRPLLKAWLDSHLPGLVERLVRAEIERVVGRAVS